MDNKNSLGLESFKAKFAQPTDADYAALPDTEPEAQAETDFQKSDPLEEEYLEIEDEVINTSTEELSIEEAREQAKGNAELFTDILAILTPTIFQLVTSDWSEESQNLYELNPHKQKAIKKALFRYFLIKRKVTDPTQALFLTIGAIYVPMIITAFNTIRERKQKSTKRKNQEQRYREAKVSGGKIKIKTYGVNEKGEYRKRPGRSGADLEIVEIEANELDEKDLSSFEIVE